MFTSIYLVLFVLLFDTVIVYDGCLQLCLFAPNGGDTGAAQIIIEKPYHAGESRQVLRS
jgi:hypothetical protein